MNRNNTDDLQSDIDDHKKQNALQGQKGNCSKVSTRDYDSQRCNTPTSHNLLKPGVVPEM